MCTRRLCRGSAGSRQVCSKALWAPVMHGTSKHHGNHGQVCQMHYQVYMWNVYGTLYRFRCAHPPRPLLWCLATTAVGKLHAGTAHDSSEAFSVLLARSRTRLAYRISPDKRLRTRFLRICGTCAPTLRNPSHMFPPQDPSMQLWT